MFRGRTVAMACIVLVAVLVAAAGTWLFAGRDSGGPHRASVSAAAPRFVETACTDTIAGHTLRCGYVDVPMDRSRPNGATVRLPLIVVHASDTPRADPILFLGGGGGLPVLSNIQNYEFSLALPSLDHDIVYIDQRGAGATTPLLECPEYVDSYYQWLAQLPSAQSEPTRIAGVTKCRDRLVRNGVELEAYSTVAIAQDMVDVMAALGYDTWDVYSVSYGTRVAQALLRDHPTVVRAAVLDSPIPLQSGISLDLAANTERTLARLQHDCDAVPECATAYPDLLGLLKRAMANLDANPPTLPVSRVDGPPGLEVLTGDRFLYGTWEMLASTTNVLKVPLVLHEVANGDLVAAGAAQVDPGAAGQAWGLTMSLTCNDQVPFYTPSFVAAAQQGVDPVLAAAAKRFVIDPAIANCDVWPHETPSPTDNQPVTTAAPVLLLIGEYDPIAPPEYGEELQRTMAHASLSVATQRSHAVTFGDRICAGTAIDQFLLDPSTFEATNCGENSLSFALP